ncbi:hypothetical protein JL721_2476 [Aureococcus anophagefferens]|nr:hypothetical protein JL721_2476 [Aureococcus anophagefferens]
MMRGMLLGRCLAALAVVAGEHFQDNWVMHRGGASLTTDPTYADLAVRIDFSSLGGPGQRLLGGISMGSTIALESFATQFLLDVSFALGVDTDRLYVLNVTEGDVHFAWGWTTTIVRFRMLEEISSTDVSVAAAVRDFTDQTQHAGSKLLTGNVTGALDRHWGAVALDWDMSLRLMYSMEVVGQDLIHQAGEGRTDMHATSDGHRAWGHKTLNQGATRWCEEEAAPESAYCEFERYFEEDISRALGVHRDRVEVLFIRPASPDSVLAHFRIFPTTDTASEGNVVAAAVADLVDQVQDASSSLFGGNVTVRVDPAWGVSGVDGAPRTTSSEHIPYAARGNESLPFHGYAAHALSPGYERCKATQRCARGYEHYDVAAAAYYHTSQVFAGGAHVPADLFAGFENWRSGSHGWAPRGSSWSGLNGSVPGGEGVGAPRGAHFAPMRFDRLGPQIRTVDAWGWCHERQPCGPFWNGGLVLNERQQHKDVVLQAMLVENVEDDLRWIESWDETALLDADGRKVVLEDLTASQCENVTSCSLLFNTSSMVMTGALEVVGTVATMPGGEEVAVFAFDSIELGPEVNVDAVGQRPSLSRVGRDPGDVLDDDPRDVPLGDPAILSGTTASNNVNGPGAPSVRVHLRTVTTRARDVDEVQRVAISSDDGETLGGHFRLTYAGRTTRSLHPGVTADALRQALEEDLNRGTRRGRGDSKARAGNEVDVYAHLPGVGRVTVTHALGGPRGDEDDAWVVTFTSTSGAMPLLGDLPTVVAAAVSRSDAERGGECDDGLCDGGPYAAGGLTWSLTLATLDDNASPRGPTDGDALADPSDPCPELAADGAGLSGINASVQASQSLGESHRDHLRSLNGTAPACESSFSLAFGGAGARGGLGRSPCRARRSTARTAPAPSAATPRRSPATMAPRHLSAADYAAWRGAGPDALDGANLTVGNGTALFLSGDGGTVGGAGRASLVGRGGAGGGAIEIVAVNDLHLGANCRVSVDGADGRSAHLSGGGGGSGGSVLLSAGGVLTLEGDVSARGGAGGPAQAGGGGGGGGRVAVYGRSLSTREAWGGLEPRLDVAGGACREWDAATQSVRAGCGGRPRNRARDGRAGTTYVESRFELRYDALIDDDDDPVGGAFGTKGALRVRGRSLADTAAATVREMPVPYDGPEYELAARNRPPRLSFFVRRDPYSLRGPAKRDAGSWGAMLVLYDANAHNASRAADEDDADPAKVGFPDFASPLPSASNPQGANATVAVGVLLTDRLTHGSGFGSRRASTRTAARARFDEIYVGPDHTMAFRCPATTRRGVEFETPRPEILGWGVEDLGDRTTLAEMRRHDTHVSRRELYQHYNGDLVAYDGTGHVQYRSDVVQRFDTGDLRGGAGAVNAGALLTLAGGVAAGGGPSRLVVDAARSPVSDDGAWTLDHADAEFDLGNFPGNYGNFPRSEFDADAPQRLDGFAEWEINAHWYGGEFPRGRPTPTHFWYGEHDAPHGPLNDGDAAPDWLAGGVGACSTDDLVTWKREGIALHYANLSDMVRSRDDWLPGCDGYATIHGTAAGYGCVGSRGLHATRPRVLLADLRTMPDSLNPRPRSRPDAPDAATGQGFVMWMGVDNATRGLALAGVASAAHAGGPFAFRRSLYPDGNETRDQAVWAIGGGAPDLASNPYSTALLGRTYFADVEHLLPSPQMQPIWEMVKDPEGRTDFGLSYHRGIYQREYDDYHDIYLQRWRLEDKPWESSGANFALCPDPDFYKIVLGQGYDDIEKEAVGITVPAVKAQPWNRNYVDGSCGIRANDEDYALNDPEIPNRDQVDRGNCSNIEDNPMHPTMPDELVGELYIVETRRAKYVAVSTLTPDLLDTTGALDAFEGELEDMDLDGLMQSYGQFDWSILGNGDPKATTFQQPIEAPDVFNLKPRLKSATRFHQYQTHYNDRAFYSLSCVYDGTCPVQFEDQLIDPEVDATADDPTIDWATSTTNYHPDEPPAWTVNPESSWSTDQWRRALFGGGGAPASGAPPAFGAPPLDDDPGAARAARDATWDAAASGYSWGDDGGGGGSGKDPWAHIRRR